MRGVDDVDGDVAHKQHSNETRRSGSSGTSSADRYWSLFEFASDAIFVESFDGRILDVNQRACELLQYTKDELCNMTVENILTPEWRARVNEVRKVLKERGSLLLETSNLRKDGSSVDVEINIRAVNWGEEDIILVFARDISARRRAQMWNAVFARLGRSLSVARSAKDATRVIADAADELIGWHICSVNSWASEDNTIRNVLLLDTKDGRHHEINRETRRVPPSELIRNVLRRGRVLIRKNLDRLSRFAPDVVEVLSRPPVAVMFVPIRVGLRVTGVIWVGRYEGSRPYEDYDLESLQTLADYCGGALDRIRVEEQLEYEKERLAVTLQSIGDGVIASDTNGCVVLMNPVAENLTGWSQAEAQGRPVNEVFHIVNERTREPCPDPVRKVLDSGTVVGLANHTALIARDGTERLIADSGAPIRDKNGRVMGVVMVFRDVTEKRRLEEDLRRMDKLEAVGVLAGGIAHDFNNILTVILGNISVGRLSGGIPEDVDRRLECAETACLRAQDLTQRLLTFARGGAPIKQTAMIKDLVKETATFVLSGSNINCEVEIDDDLWPVDVDIGQISQVIQNLVINAKEAMPNGGTIKIRARNCSANLMHPLPEGSRYVCVSVQDSGVGITQEHLSRIFDPYFTTKGSARGLGLAICYSIVRNHGGRIAVESEPGKGSTFFVYLPASNEPLKEDTSSETPTTERVTRHVLVMDDEYPILRVTKEILGGYGYRVECALDGVEAVRQFIEARQSGDPFDVVILDLTVPGGIGALGTLRRLQQVDPGIKAVVASSYSSNDVIANCQQYGFRAAIQKPFRPSELLSVIEGLLAEEQSPTDGD